MGGLGSGQHYRFNSKHLTSGCLKIDVRSWHRKNLLSENQKFTTSWLIRDETVGSISVETGINKIILSYRKRDKNNQWQNIQYDIRVSWSKCHLGGSRPWFHCPATNCGRRVAILYAGSIFACRRCHQLAYPSQRENFGDRAGRKAEKIRTRLNWEPGILNGEGLKPKGIHWKTFEKLCAKHNILVELSLADAKLRFGITF